MPELVVKMQGRAEAVIALNQIRLIVGRGEKADLRIQDNLASRSHCQFIPMANGRWLINDMDSRNGTRVNGEVVKKKILEHNDNIQIGHTLIRYVEKSSVEAKGNDIYALADDDPVQSAQDQYAVAGDDESVDLGGLEDKAPPPDPDAGVVGGGSAKAGPGNRGQCPNCNANIDRSVVICINCGYNFNTAHVMATAAAEPPPSHEFPVMPTAGASQLEREIDEEHGQVTAMDAVRERWGPVVALVAGVLIQAAVFRFTPVGLVTILIGLAMRTAFLMVTMLVTARIVGSSFGSLPLAILKAASIMAMVVAITSLGSIFGFGFFFFIIFIYAGTLGGLLYFFFDLDAFEIFMLMGINYLLENFVVLFVLTFIGAAML